MARGTNSPGPGLFWRGGVIWCRWKTNGHKFARSTGQRDPRQAARAYRQIRAAVESAERPALSRDSLESLATADLTRKRGEGHSEIHLDRLEARWAKIVSVAGPATTPQAFDPETYAAVRRAMGVKGQTIRRELQLVKRAFLSVGVSKASPTIRSDPEDERKAGKYWTPAQLAAFLAELHPAARAEALLAACTGLRSAELKRLRWEWVKLNHGLLELPQSATKSRKARVVALSSLAVSVLADIGQNREGFVLPRSDFKKARRDASKRAGLPCTVTLRDLRHTFATNALANCPDPAALMATLGHSNLSMTERYLSSTLDRARGIVEAAANGLAVARESGTPARQRKKRSNLQGARSSAG